MKRLAFAFLAVLAFAAFAYSQDKPDVLNYSNEQILDTLQSGDWLSDPWYSMAAYGPILNFSKDGTGWWGEGYHLDAIFKYVIKERKIYLYNRTEQITTKDGVVINLFDDRVAAEMVLEPDNNSIFGNIRLRVVSSAFGNAANVFYPKKLISGLKGSMRIYEGFKLKMLDSPEALSKYAVFYKGPSSANPMQLAASSFVFTVADSERYDGNYTYDMQCVGSTVNESKKWYLYSISYSDGNKDGEGYYYVWTDTTPGLYPKVIYDYYYEINKGKYENAYKLWHQKKDYAYFVELYKDVKEIRIVSCTILTEKESEFLVILVENGTDKETCYKVVFEYTSDRILSSTSVQCE